MKKLFLVLALLVLPAIARADEFVSVGESGHGTSIIDLLASIPSMNQGVAFSIADSNINYLSTIDIVQWKGVNLEAGYAGAAKNTGDKAVAVLSYDLFKAKDYITWPILQYVEFRPGLWVGVGRIGGSNELDYGVSATFMSIKF